ncbi:Xaa-Pro aminopeptidase, partial [Vibrio vulnificus]
GAAPGFLDWTQALDIPVKDVAELELNAGTNTLVAGTMGPERQWNRGLAISAQLQRTLSELRLVKDTWELGQMRSAVAHTVDGLTAVAKEI